MRIFWQFKFTICIILVVGFTVSYKFFDGHDIWGAVEFVLAFYSLPFMIFLEIIDTKSDTESIKSDIESIKRELDRLTDPRQKNETLSSIKMIEFHLSEISGRKVRVRDKYEDYEKNF